MPDSAGMAPVLSKTFGNITSYVLLSDVEAIRLPWRVSISLPQVTVIFVCLVVTYELLVVGKCAKPKVDCASYWGSTLLWFVWLLFTMLQNAMYNLVTPTALDLSSALGADAAASGFLVSSVNTLVLGSAIVSAWVMSPWHLRRVRLAVLVFMVAATSFMYCYAWLLDSASAFAGKQIFWLLCGLRMLMGFSGTAAYCMFYCIIIRATPPSGKTGLSIVTNAFKNLGSGLGPLLSSMAIRIFVGEDGLVMRQCSSAMYLCASLFGAMALALSFILPIDETRLEQRHSQMQVSAEPARDQAPELLDVSARQGIMILAVLYCGERGFTVASVESASSMILEQQYGWHASDIGFVIMFVFFATAALSTIIMFVRVRKLMADTSLMLASAFAANVFSLLLFGVFAESPWSLLVADWGIYSAAYMAYSILCGFAARAAIQDSVWFNNEIFQSVDVAVVALGRLVGGPLSRILVNKFGRDGYALTMLVFTVCGSLSVIKVKHLFT